MGIECSIHTLRHGNNNVSSNIIPDGQLIKYEKGHLAGPLENWVLSDEMTQLPVLIPVFALLLCDIRPFRQGADYTTLLVSTRGAAPFARCAIKLSPHSFRFSGVDGVNSCCVLNCPGLSTCKSSRIIGIECQQQGSVDDLVCHMASVRVC